MTKSKREIYDVISKEIGIGTFEQFDSLTQTPEGRKKFFDVVSPNVGIGTEEQFYGLFDKPTNGKPANGKATQFPDAYDKSTSYFERKKVADEKPFNDKTFQRGVQQARPALEELRRVESDSTFKSQLQQFQKLQGEFDTPEFQKHLEEGQAFAGFGVSEKTKQYGKSIDDFKKKYPKFKEELALLSQEDDVLKTLESKAKLYQERGLDNSEIVNEYQTRVQNRNANYQALQGALTESKRLNEMVGDQEIQSDFEKSSAYNADLKKYKDVAKKFGKEYQSLKAYNDLVKNPDFKSKLDYLGTVQQQLKNVSEEQLREAETQAFADNATAWLNPFINELERKIKKYASPMEGVGMVLSPTVGKSLAFGGTTLQKVNLAEYENYKDALKLAREIQRRKTSGNYGTDLLKGMNEIITPENVPVIGTAFDLMKKADLARVSNKSKKEWTDGERAKMDAYYVLEKLKANPNYQSWSTTLGEGVGTSMLYMAEFALFDGVFRAAKDLAMSGASRAIGNRVTKKILEGVGNNISMKLARGAERMTVKGVEALTTGFGRGVQSFANLPAVARDYEERNIKPLNYEMNGAGEIASRALNREDERYFDSQITKFLKTIGVRATDFVTESFGGVIEKPISFLRGAFLKNYMKKNGISALTKESIKELKKKVAFSGPFGEYFEEESAQAISSLIEKGRYEPFTGDERLMTLATIAVQSGLFGIPSGLARARDVYKKAGATDREIERLLGVAAHQARGEFATPAEPTEQELPDLSNVEKELPDLSNVEKELPDLSNVEKELPDLSNVEKELPDLSNVEKELPDLSNVEKELGISTVVPKNPQALLKIKQLENEFAQAAKSKEKFDLQKHITKDLVSLIGDDATSLQRFEDLQTSVSAWNSQFETKKSEKVPETISTTEEQTDEKLIEEIKEKKKQAQLKKQKEPALPATDGTNKNRVSWNDADYESKINRLETDKDKDANRIKGNHDILNIRERGELDESNEWYDNEIGQLKKERAERLQAKHKVSELPNFKSTEEAVEFGLKATEEQKAELGKRREETLKEVERLRGEKKLQEALNLATQAQFDREAIEAKEKPEIPSIKQQLRDLGYTDKQIERMSSFQAENILNAEREQPQAKQPETLEEFDAKIAEVLADPNLTIDSRKQALQVLRKNRKELADELTKKEKPVEQKVGSESSEVEKVSNRFFERKVSSIKTDEERFQNREELDEERVQHIADNWNNNELDPVVLFKDENGDAYVLAGHHRLEAAKRLGKEYIDVRYFEGDEKAAIKHAEKSNTLNKPEKLVERAKVYRKQRLAGVDKKQIKKEAKTAEFDNAKIVLAMSHLNPTGKMMDALLHLPEGQSKRTMLTIAEWIGEVRETFPFLTDSHEGELYDWLVNKGAYEKVRTKTEFEYRISKIAETIEDRPEQPLNLEQRQTIGTLESAAIQQRDDVALQIRTLEKERKTAIASRVLQISKEIESLSIELGRLNAEILKASEADKQQLDMFGIINESVNKKEVSDEQVKRTESRTDEEIKKSEPIIATIEGEAKDAEDNRDAEKAAELINKVQQEINSVVGEAKESERVIPHSDYDKLYLYSDLSSGTLVWARDPQDFKKITGLDESNPQRVAYTDKVPVPKGYVKTGSGLANDAIVKKEVHQPNTELERTFPVLKELLTRYQEAVGGFDKGRVVNSMAAMLAGEGNKSLRQAIISAIKGESVPKNKSGVHALEGAFNLYLGNKGEPKFALSKGQQRFIAEKAIEGNIEPFLDMKQREAEEKSKSKAERLTNELSELKQTRAQYKREYEAFKNEKTKKALDGVQSRIEEIEFELRDEAAPLFDDKAKESQMGLFSVGTQSKTTANEELRKQQVETVITPIVAMVDNPNVEIKVVGNQSEVPGGAMASTFGGVIDALYWDLKDGKVQIYLVANNLHSPKQVVMKLAHELLGHFGLNVFGEQKEKLLDDIWRDYQKKIEGREWYKDYTAQDKDGNYVYEQYNPTTEKGRRNLAEEYLAHRFAERLVSPSLMDKLVAMLRKVLRATYPKLKLSDGELRSIMGKAYGYVIGRGTGKYSGKSGAKLYAIQTNNNTKLFNYTGKLNEPYNDRHKQLGGDEQSGKGTNADQVGRMLFGLSESEKSDKESAELVSYLHSELPQSNNNVWQEKNSRLTPEHERLVNELKKKDMLSVQHSIPVTDKVRESVIEGLPLFSFAGRNARGFEQAEREGRTFIGKYDKKERFEIDDKYAYVKPQDGWVEKAYQGVGGVWLDNVLSHDELFQNYPQLKDIQVEIIQRKTGGAAFRPAQAIITIYDDGTLLKDEEKIKSNLLHEITHAIQFLEGFASGTNLKARKTDPRVVEERNNLLSVMAEHQIDPDENFNDIIAKPDSDVWEKDVQDAAKRFVKVAGRSSGDYYYFSAGEIEARDVESRMNLNMKERAQMPPYSSESISEEDAIVVFDEQATSSLQQLVDRVLGVKLGEQLSDSDIRFSLSSNVSTLPTIPLNGFNVMKKKLGETAAKAIRTYVPFALDYPNEFVAFITKKVPIKEDIPFIVQHMGTRLDALFRLEADKNIKTAPTVSKTPEELSKEAGYVFHRPKSVKDIVVFKKDFQNGEVLCTFNDVGGRLADNFIFWLRRSEAETVVPAGEVTQEYLRQNGQGAGLWRGYLEGKGLKKKDDSYDLTNLSPSRQDPYGTSSMSVQINRRNGNISIKNRYNHTVNNPDATFGNDLNNIIDGLHDAIYKIEGVPKQSKQQVNLPEGIESDSEGRYMHSERELEGVHLNKYGYMKNGVITAIDKSHQRMIDEYVFDTKQKNILSILNGNSLMIGKNTNIRIKKEPGGYYTAWHDGNQIIQEGGSGGFGTRQEAKQYAESKVGADIIAIKFDGENINVNTDNGSIVFGFADGVVKKLSGTLTSVGNSFLSYNETLSELELPSLTSVGNYFLSSNKTLSEKIKAQIQKRKQKPDGGSPLFSLASTAGAVENEVEEAKREWVEKGVESKFFRKWFAESKVVDEQGKPLVVYHGTSSTDYTKFKRRMSDVGIHFGTKGQANDRLEFVNRENKEIAERTRIYPVYLSIKKPLRLKDAGWWDYNNLDYVLENSGKFTKEEIQRTINSSDSAVGKTKALQRLVRSKGYDGIVYKNEGETQGAFELENRKREAWKLFREKYPSVTNTISPEMQQTPEYRVVQRLEDEARTYREQNAEDSYIVFEPNQIKSATGNQGTFSESEDIRFSLQKNLKPEEAPERIGIAQIPSEGQPKSIKQMMKDLADIVENKIVKAKQKRRVAGSYHSINAAITIGQGTDLDTTAHEVGHFLDDYYGIAAEWKESRVRSPLDANLSKFWWHGSATKTGRKSKLSYKRAEGIAEFVRAWLFNPERAVQEAPDFYKHFENKVPKEIRDKLQTWGEDVRKFAGTDPLLRTLANVNTVEPKGIKEKLREMFKKEGYGFEVTLFDRMEKRLSDSLAPVWKAINVAKALRGIETLLPKINPETRIRLFAGINEKLENIYKWGMIKANGNLHDKAHSFIDMLSDYDATSEKTLNDDKWYAVALMVNERILEEGKNLDKRSFKEIQEQIEAEIARLEEMIPTLDDIHGKEADEAIEKIQGLNELLNEAKNATTALDSLYVIASGGFVRYAAIANKMIAVNAARKARLTGTGGGIFKDDKEAVLALESFERLPDAKKQHIRSGVKKYRETANQALQYLRDKGRISAKEYDEIVESHEFYVSFKRIMDKVAPVRGVGSKKLGTVSKVIYKFKGGQVEIDDPYVSLMKQIADSVREADRNEAIRLITDLLSTSRGMYEGEVLKLAEIGYKGKSGDDNAIKVYRDGKEEYWIFHEELYRALKELDGVEFGEVLKFFAAPAQLMRNTITHAPDFLIRNVPRDVFSRYILSRVDSKLLESFKGFTAEEKRQLGLTGGLQAGHYMLSRVDYQKAQKKAILEIIDRNKGLGEKVKDIIVHPSIIFGKYNDIAKASESIGRIAEARTAYKYAVEKLGYDEENAMLYAALQARDLLDYAIAGTWVRPINQLVPFTNAALRGIVKYGQRIKEAPSVTIKKTLIATMPLSLAVYALAAGGDDEEELWQQPAYIRDMFWNFKLAPDVWIRIPKPFEMGLFASATERAIASARGDKNAYDGYWGSVYKSLFPFDDVFIGGYLKYLNEMISNYDTFRERYIVPPNENDLDLDMRKGTEYASRLGKIFQGVLGVDARKIDYLIENQFGGFGRLATRVSDIPEKGFSPVFKTGAGVIIGTPSSQARDVQFVTEIAKERGQLSSKPMKELTELKKDVYESENASAKQTAALKLIQRSKKMREEIEEGTLWNKEEILEHRKDKEEGRGSGGRGSRSGRTGRGGR